MKEIKTNCPVCDSKNFADFLNVTDHSVSKEQFLLLKCTDCDFVFTQSCPTEASIAPYYQFAEYISHTNTSKGLFYKVYHLVRNFTLGQKLRWLKKFSKKETGSLLDIGSGVGSFLNFARSKNWQVLGIEPDENARKNAASINNIEALPAAALYNLSETFDAITMWHVLEHVHQLKQYLARLQELIKPDGVVIIAVPNYTSFDANYYKANWAAYDVPRHLYHFSPKAMHTLVSQFGFEVVAKKPMWFDSVYVSILSEKYKNGFAPIGIVVGLWSNIVALFNRNKCSSLAYVLKKRV